MKLVISPAANEDLRQISLWIRKDNPNAARKVHQTIMDTMHALTKFPQLGRQSGVDPRALVVNASSYRIHYEIRDDQIKVLAVKHQHQDEAGIDL